MADAVHDGPRMNSLIHRAVRRDLDAFTVALDGFPAGDRERALALAARFRWLDTLLTHHHEGEEEILWPVLRGTPTDVEEVGELTDEHERIVSALAGARAAMARFGGSGSASDAATASTAIADLRSAALEHFQHEEGEIVELCSHADPAALATAFKQLGRQSGMREGMWFLQWVSDGASPDDVTFLRTLIPPPVHWVAKRVAGRSYAKASAPLHA